MVTPLTVTNSYITGPLQRDTDLVGSKIPGQSQILNPSTKNGLFQYESIRSYQYWR